MKDFFENLLDWIYKKRCYFCKSSKESSRMCSKCFEELDYLPIEVNRNYKDINIYCAGVYSKNLQKMIRGLKYHNQKDLAYFCAKFMYQYWEKLNIEGEFQIIPVPMHEKRLRKRKYNHMELVAQEFAQITGFEVNTKLIKRIKDTKPQYNLNKAQRMENLSKAFAVEESNLLPNKKVLIIDDICTTGSTFEEMINVLYDAGIKDIVCFATTTPFGD